MSDPTQLRERALQAVDRADDELSNYDASWSEWKLAVVDAVLTEVARECEARRDAVRRLMNATSDPRAADCWETAAIQLGSLLSVLRPSEGSEE